MRLMDLECSPASLEATHSYMAVSSTVGAITTREPDDSNLEMPKRGGVSFWKQLYSKVLPLRVQKM